MGIICIVLVAGQNPALNRYALAGDGKTDGHQRQIVSFVFGLAICLQL
jgi:hypothetical protein